MSLMITLFMSQTSFAAGALDPYKATDGSANVVMYEDSASGKLHVNIETYSSAGKVHCEVSELFAKKNEEIYVLSRPGCVITVHKFGENEISIGAQKCEGMCVSGASGELNIDSATR